MDELKIKTIVGVCPPDAPIIPSDEYVRYISRGATVVFEFDLDQKAYTFNDIEQLSFLFKQYNKLLKYDLYTEGKVLNPLFCFDYDDYNEVIIIKLRLPAEETVKFKKTTKENLIPCEVMIHLNSNEDYNQDETTILENLPPLNVTDTLYGKFLERKEEN